VQEYSSAKAFTFTPALGETGNYRLQVWVRTAGSGQQYEAVRNSNAFALLGTSNFIFNSEPGDPIGAGQRIIHGAFDGTAQLQHDSAGQNINTYFFGDGLWYWWHLDFGAKTGSTLAPGVYEQATLFPFNSTGPGLSIRGDDRSCSEVRSRFVVVDLARNAANEITRFAADFEQHCDNSQAGLRGSAARFATTRRSRHQTAPSSSRVSPQT
jgi:hypothetical protein